MSLLFRARGVTPGRAEGLSLVSRRAFTFAHGVDPATGTVTDVRSDIKGENVRGRVLIFPFGKGSTTASAWFLETVRLGNGPAAVLTESIDPGVVIGSVLAKVVYGKEIPVVASVPKELLLIASGANLKVDGSGGTVRID